MLPLNQVGVWLYYMFSFLFSDFSNFKAVWPKTIWVLRILEYYTISMLNYFEGTLANVGLPEDWLECDSNDVTQIENNYVKRKSSQIGKNLSRIPSKTLSQIELELLNFAKLIASSVNRRKWMGSWRKGRAVGVCNDRNTLQDCRPNHRCRCISGRVGKDSM